MKKESFVAFFASCLIHLNIEASSNLRPFSSDGCSSSPDSFLGTSIVHCCVNHDFEYWLGGTALEKSLADSNLEHCIGNELSIVGQLIGSIYHYAVSIGGKPHYLSTSLKSPFHWRWGYGWESAPNYRTLDEDEITMGLEDLYRLRLSLDDHERNLNETKGYAWRFQGLEINHQQFNSIRVGLENKILRLEKLLSKE